MRCAARSRFTTATQTALFVVQAKHCKPTPKCLAAYLAAVQPLTYLHCLYNGDSVVSKTHFPEMDYYLGAPTGDAQETEPGSQVWRRTFASGTVVLWDNKKKNGNITWAGQPPTPTPPPTPAPPTPSVPASCGALLVDMGLGQHDLGHQTKTATAAECCSQCQEMSGCEAWSWHTEKANTCHFHDAQAVRNPKDVGSGVYSAYLPGTYV